MKIKLNKRKKKKQTKKTAVHFFERYVIYFIHITHLSVGILHSDSKLVEDMLHSI